MKIAVIGAGASGLVAIKHCLQNGYDFEAFEQTECIGGTWNYTDEVGLDKNGLPIHTSMYKNLRTNIPKELMLFDDFPYPDHLKRSYLLQNEVLQYLHDFASKNDLSKCIKFLTRITSVEPTDDNKWDIEIQDVVSKKKEKKVFDVVICCIGKYSVPSMPDIPGLDSFLGTCVHSHDYRLEEPYKDRRVLVIGGGPSGVDICNLLSKVAKKVILSQRSSPFSFSSLNGEQKPEVAEIIGSMVKFQDGATEQIDDIIFCTGYVFNYPFLSEKCKITVDNNYVSGLYKELICVEYPTLIVMGIPGRICPFPTFELQMRFVMKMLKGELQLPSKNDMLKEIENDRKAKDCPNRHYHNKGVAGEQKYWDDLSEFAHVKGIPVVLSRLHEFVIKQKRNLNQSFKILNDEEFEVYEL